MVEWWPVAASFLWILGLALLLATFSYRSCVASQRDIARKGSADDHATLLFRLGLLLFAVGLGATAENWIERLLWGVIALVALFELIHSRLYSQPQDNPSR